MPTSTRARATALALCAAAAVLAAAPADAQRTERGALVTTLGNDTLALERWTRAGNRIDAEVVVRSPRTVLRRFTLELSPEGGFQRWEDLTLDPARPDAAPLRRETVAGEDGAWTRAVTVGDSTATTPLPQFDTSALPWVDLVHWPFELATQRALAAGQATGEQPFLAGGRPLRYGIAVDGARVTLTHPLRGPSVATVDEAGRIRSLDAGQTTRKVIVTRVPDVEIAATARRWAALDGAGRGVGELSGRANDTATVAGARIALDYGTPLARGRAIWGNIVPFGQVWRTGANRATHLSTSRPLVLGTGAGALEVPAGEYTLFSIPAADGGVLIVNRQTGQNGTAYDAARDLGRVALERRALAEPVERFTIRADAAGASGGLLRIQWADGELVVPFQVR